LAKYLVKNYCTSIDHMSFEILLYKHRIIKWWATHNFLYRVTTWHHPKV